MANEDAFSFLKGILFGAVAGALAGVLLAPKAGAETREDLKKLAIEFGEKATELYTQAEKILKKKLKQIQMTGEKLDEKKYLKLVSEVVDEIKKDSVVTADVAKKISTQLKKDWTIVKDEFAK